MGRIPDDTIQTIRDRVDLVELIGRHISLRKRGATWWGLCPFHGEKTPSFHVSRERGFYHCFGCAEGGNAFDFLIKHDNLSFPEAVRSLAAECGVEVPEAGGGEPGLSERLVAANDVAQRFYRAALAAPAGRSAGAYLEGRGLDAASIESAGIGFAPDRWDGLTGALAKEKIPADIGVRAGLLKERDSGGHYDLLRNRITFPIRDARGRIVAFGGRALGEEQQPKYLNSPETPLFRKREAFYGMPDALEPIRRQERAVVVEGYFDAIALRRAGVPEVLATCGTALGEGHGRALRRRVREVVLLFDGDEAGQRAVLRALELLLPQGLRVRAAALPEGEDPDDFLRREGPEALRALVDGAVPALEVAIRRAVSVGCATPWEKADAVAAVVPLLCVIPEAVERGEFGRRLALAAGVTPAEVDAAVRAEARGQSAPEPEAPAERAAPLPGPASPAERRLGDLVRILMSHPQHVAALEDPELRAHAPQGPWSELLEGLVEVCSEAPTSDPMAALEQRLPAPARARLLALLADPDPLFEDEERALRALHDIVSWFERLRRQERQRNTTQQLRESTGDRSALLEEKNRELARRRASLQDSSPG